MLKQTYLAIAAGTMCLILSACFPGSDGDVQWATRKQVVEAASRCGVNDFEPTQIGEAWAAYVAGENPDKGPKGNCIYADLKSQGLTATR